jgi:hypothetical protein
MPVGLQAEVRARGVGQVSGQQHAADAIPSHLSCSMQILSASSRRLRATLLGVASIASQPGAERSTWLCLMTGARLKSALMSRDATVPSVPPFACLSSVLRWGLAVARAKVGVAFVGCGACGSAWSGLEAKTRT